MGFLSFGGGWLQAKIRKECYCCSVVEARISLSGHVSTFCLTPFSLNSRVWGYLEALAHMRRFSWFVCKCAVSPVHHIP
jgi:hypothetical protein